MIDSRWQVVPSCKCGQQDAPGRAGMPLCTGGRGLREVLDATVRLQEAECEDQEDGTHVEPQGQACTLKPVN